MEFSTIYDVCVGSGRPFKLLNPRNVGCHRTADEAGWQDHGDPVHENAGLTRFQDLDVHSWESQEDTGVDFDIALVPEKNLLHDSLRNYNRAQMLQQMSELQY